MAQHKRKAHPRHLDDKVVPVRDAIVNRDEPKKLGPRNADPQWRESSTAGITEIAQQENATPTVRVVRGEGSGAGTYYYGDNQILIKAKPSKIDRKAFRVIAVMQTGLVGGTVATAAVGLFPATAALAALTANMAPRFADTNRSFARSYGSESVTPAGVETVDTFNAFTPSPSRGFIPADDIASVRVYTARPKLLRDHHTGVQVVLNDGSTAALNMSRQTPDQQHLVEELAQHIGRTLNKPVDANPRIYLQDELQQHEQALVAPTLLQTLRNKLKRSKPQR